MQDELILKSTARLERSFATPGLVRREIRDLDARTLSF